MSQYVGPNGRPVDGAGNEVPEDPSQWGQQLTQYLTTYWFGAQEHGDHEEGSATIVASIPEIQHEGGGSYA